MIWELKITKTIPYGIGWGKDNNNNHSELIRAANDQSVVHNHGGGPYYGLFLVESAC